MRPRPRYRGWSEDNPQVSAPARLRDAPSNDLPEESIREALQKIKSSKLFAGSLRHSRFLQYTVDQTLLGNGTRLKEYVLATEVINRKDSFDPHLDAIVRVEASRIRAKLNAYYATEGREDPIFIEFPKGTYVPTFRRRPDPSKILESSHDVPIRGWRKTSILLLVLLSSLAAISWKTSALFWIHPREQGSSVIRPAWIGSLAVLPFVNSSDEKESDYLADDLTAELINNLSKLESLHVVARTSVLQFKGRAADVREIGKQLNAQVVLEGTLKKEDNRVRVIVDLIDVRTGYLLWSGAYNYGTQHIISMQTDIAAAIVKVLRTSRAATTPAGCINSKKCR